MKLPFSSKLLPQGCILLTCSSHEERCRGLISKLDRWTPAEAILFHYDDPNPRREENHRIMEAQLRQLGVTPVSLQFTESNAVKSLRDNMDYLRGVLENVKGAAVVLDISVFTKRHLLMTLRWLDDAKAWERLCVVYSEPEDYDVSRYIPLSFGLSSMQQIPGFSACPDLSRPVHLVLFLGYEGDRALAVYEQIQPMRTTLVVPDPPYKPAWLGRTEKANEDLLAVVGADLTRKVDAVDPDATKLALERILGGGPVRGQYAKVVGPLGTKPQTLGIYAYARECSDPPAIVYASPLRHNHDFFSHGLGKTWLLKIGSP
jgi:hypothetical protein